MTLIYPSEDLRIMDYNRVLRTLNGLDSSEFLGKLGKCFHVSKVDKPETARFVMSLYLDTQWYRCEVKPEVILESQKDAVDCLDVSILSDKVLRDILGITNIRNDSRIDFVGGSRGMAGLIKRCQQDCVAAFAMHPVDIDDLLTVADRGLCMPPKSTWFEPKPRSGFVVRIFD